MAHFDCPASEDDLRRSVCYIDGWLFRGITDFTLCYERAEEYDEAEAFFEDQVNLIFVCDNGDLITYESPTTLLTLFYYYSCCCC